MPEIICLPYGYFEACCYLIRLPSACCLIDPCVSAEQLPDDLPPIRWLVATHGHFDHISHADQLRQSLSAPLYIHRSEADYLRQPQLNLSVTMQRSTSLQPADSLLEDGQVLTLSDGYSLKVMHTPGHTPGCVCLILQENGQPAAIFSGDTLFAGSIGRLDLGGNLNDMIRTLHRLQDYGRSVQAAGQPSRELPVYPGHGPATELQFEIRTNPYFRMRPEEIDEAEF